MSVNYSKLYERYKTEYRKATEAQHKAGFEMADPRMLTESQFKHYYNVVKKDTELRKREGKLSQSTIVDTTMKIVKKQRYEVSYKQARAFQMAEINQGRKPTSLRKIQSGQADWDFVKEEYRKLKKAGYSGKAANRAIAELFYVYA